MAGAPLIQVHLARVQSCVRGKGGSDLRRGENRCHVITNHRTAPKSLISKIAAVMQSSLFDSVLTRQKPLDATPAGAPAPRLGDVNEEDLHRLLDGIERLKAQHAEVEKQYEQELAAAKSSKAGSFLCQHPQLCEHSNVTTVS